MRIGMLKSIRASILAFGVIVGGTAAQADSSTWYVQYFEQQKLRGLGGPVSASKPSITGKRSTSTASRSKSQGVRTASLGRPDLPTRRPSVGGGGGVSWVASSGCLNGSLKGVIYGIASSFGSVTVSSTCRNAAHNRRVGGASKSYHLGGDAADFRVHGNVSAAYAALRSNGSVGGLKHYGGGLFHIDTGPRRSW